MIVTIIPETKFTKPIQVNISFLAKRDNVYGGIVIEGPLGFYAQKSGHGAWCDLRFWRYEVWADPITGRPFHFVRR